MGRITDIQRACSHDGPGIRTTVFLKGCPLRCLWCHNPETHEKEPQLLYDGNLCVRCGRCAALCPRFCHAMQPEGHTFDRTSCVACGKCVNPFCDALEIAGRDVTAEAVMAVVKKDAAFYRRSDGGLTVSGGEPLFQPDFTYELLALAKSEGISTAVETSGCGARDDLTKIASVTDVFLFDVKETDAKRHKACTGVDNKSILENLKALDKRGNNTILRCPIIPGVNDRPDHFLGLAQIANACENVIKIEIEPYHPLGMEKYAKLGLTCPYENTAFPSAEAVGSWMREIARHTNVKVTKA